MIVSEDKPSWWFGRASFFRREEKGERREGEKVGGLALTNLVLH